MHSIQRVLKSIFLCSTIALSLSSILRIRVYSRSWSRKSHPGVSVFMYGHQSGNFVPVPEKSICMSKFLANELHNFLNTFFIYLISHIFRLKIKRSRLDGEHLYRCRQVNYLSFSSQVWVSLNSWSLKLTALSYSSLNLALWSTSLAGACLCACSHTCLRRY